MGVNVQCPVHVCLLTGVLLQYQIWILYVTGGNIYEAAVLCVTRIHLISSDQTFAIPIH